MQEEYEDALDGKSDLNINLAKLGNLNELNYEILILSINTGSAVE